jgi:hypothetical protein
MCFLCGTDWIYIYYLEKNWVFKGLEGWFHNFKPSFLKTDVYGTYYTSNTQVKVCNNLGILYVPWRNMGICTQLWIQFRKHATSPRPALSSWGATGNAAVKERRGRDVHKKMNRTQRGWRRRRIKSSLSTRYLRKEIYISWADKKGTAGIQETAHRNTIPTAAGLNGYNR